MILRIDDIVSSITKKDKWENGSQKADDENQETFGDQRDG